MSELPKAYQPAEVESKWYQTWLDERFFEADPASEKPGFSIVIPPPNVTGVLHMGHVLNNTIQDILARKARMEGKDIGDWVLIDTGDVIVHVFRPEVREFYQLEKMWQSNGDPAALQG